MKSSLKVIAVLALTVGAGMAGNVVLASCTEADLTAVYPVVQCGAVPATWFAPPPAGAGAVSVAWWQVGMGNATQSATTNVGADGSGFRAIPLPATFFGNDSGVSTGNPANLDLVQAPAPAPPGALCFNQANWSRLTPLQDGCADNVRTGDGPAGAGGSLDDDKLNSEYYSGKVLAGGGFGLPTTGYVVDAPMGVLLTESSGRSFALAFFATEPRRAPTESDRAPGRYVMATINTGDPNPANPALLNIVPWQPIPTPDASGVLVDPANPASARMVSLNWTPSATKLDGAAKLVHDSSSRPSSHVGFPAGVTGMGTTQMGPLIRYAVETAPILDAAGTCGAFVAGAGTTNTQASLTVPQNTCLRLRTLFGRQPATTTVNATNAREGFLGDIGYSVVSRTILIGGDLVSNQITLDSAVKKQGTLIVTFHTGSELNGSRYDVIGFDSKSAKESVIGSTNCTACTSGLGSVYTIQIPASSVKGAKSVQIRSSSGDVSNKVDITGS